MYRIGPGFTLSGDILEITDAMVDAVQPMTAMCVATNMINSVTYNVSNNVTFTVGW